MEAQIWTLIGILTATLVGTLVYLGGRIDGLASQIDAKSETTNARIERLGNKFDSRFDDVNARIDGTHSRLDSVSTDIYRVVYRLDEHLRRHAG